MIAEPRRRDARPRVYFRDAGHGEACPSKGNRDRSFLSARETNSIACKEVPRLIVLRPR